MLQEILQRIDRRLTALDLTDRAASIKAGLSADAIRNIRRAAKNGTHDGITTSTLIPLAKALETTPGWLLDGQGDEEASEALTVPVVGRVGASNDGLVIFTTAHETGDVVPIPPGGTMNARALQVTGHSMRGFADDGALLYFEEQRLPPTPDMLGYVVVLETVDGEVLVKRLLRGSRPGLYDLESLSGPTLHDRELAWAANITAITPPARPARSSGPWSRDAAYGMRQLMLPALTATRRVHRSSNSRHTESTVIDA